jgi:hypothetical protein
MRVRESLRSPALWISIVALVFAVGGTSLANTIGQAIGLSGTQRKQAKQIADSEIKHKASKLSVASAVTATRATAAVEALTAINADDLGGTPASSYARVLDSGVKTIPNSTAKPTPTPVLTFGPFTAQATCSTVDGTLTLAFNIAYPAGTTVGDTGGQSAAGTFSLDVNPNQVANSPVHDSDNGDFSNILSGLTLFAGNGTPYHLISAWDATNFPSNGSCGAEAFVVQG